jgi:hypothetical protein
MLSVLKRELNDYPDHTSLKRNINKIYSELSRRNYDNVIQMCDLSIEVCDRIKEQAIALNNEEVANSMFVVKAYCKMLKYYSMYWKTLLNENYKDSWLILQDAIDRLIDVTKFTNDHCEFGIDKFNEHLYELEKLYPYKVFASSEMVIKTKKCSICGKSVLDLDCVHTPGNLYWGQKAVTICEDIVFQAVALVQHPMDKRCIIELSGDIRTDKEKFQLLDFFVQNNKNPLRLFSVTEIDKYYYNEKYDKAKRNDPCPCNSGKKFKKCCGQNKYEKGSHFQIKFKNEIQLTPLLIPSSSTL